MMLRLSLVLALLGPLTAHAQVVVVPPPIPAPPVYVAPPPPPVYVAPPTPRVYVAPPRPIYAPPPVVLVQAPPPPQSRYRLLSNVFIGVGVPLLTLGFFSLVAGIPVTVLTQTERICSPTPSRSCEPYYQLSYGLLGGGAAAMVTGIVFVAIGRVFRVRSHFAKIELQAPRVALLRDASGGIDGATASMGFRF